MTENHMNVRHVVVYFVYQKKSYCKLIFEFENNEYLIKTNFISHVMLYVSVARPPHPHTQTVTQ